MATAEFRPTSDYGTPGWYNLGAANNWSNVDDPGTHDGNSTYNRTTGLSISEPTAVVDLFGHDNHSIPNGSTINSVTVTAYGFSARMQPMMRVALGYASQTNQYGDSYAAAYPAYTTHTKTWNSNPWTTNPWSLSEINGIKFGYQGYGYDAGEDGIFYANVTQVILTVDYTEPVATAVPRHGFIHHNNPAIF